MKRVQSWLWSGSILVMLVLAFVGYWRYENWIHATPEKSQASQNHSIPFQTISFAHGAVVFSIISNDIVQATYMTKGFWGWHGVMYDGQSAQSEKKAEFGTDTGALTVDNQPLVWSTFLKPKKILFNYDGHVYQTEVSKGSRVWYVILPFATNPIHTPNWRMVLPNGKTERLFDH